MNLARKEYPVRAPHALTALALMFAFTACASQPVPAADDAAVQQEIADRLVAFQSAILAGDAEPFLGFWTSDARALEPGVDRSGEEFRQYVRDFFAGGKVTSIDIQPYERFVHGDVAYEMGQYDETAQVQGQPPMTFKNYYFARWERGEDGQWRFDRLVAGPRAAPAGM